MIPVVELVIPVVELSGFGLIMSFLFCIMGFFVLHNLENLNKAEMIFLGLLVIFDI